MGASKDLATVTMTLVPNTWKWKHNLRYLQEKQKKITVHSWCINNMSQGQQMAKQLSFARTHIRTRNCHKATIKSRTKRRQPYHGRDYPRSKWSTWICTEGQVCWENEKLGPLKSYSPLNNTKRQSSAPPPSGSTIPSFGQTFFFYHMVCT